MAALEEEDDDDYDGEECDKRKKLEVKAHQASHTKYLMMRGYCCPGIGSVSVCTFTCTGEEHTHTIKTLKNITSLCFLSSQTT